ncbi:MAG TPA: hypothetical protein VLA59_03940 [Patescibacteria group bacterium]|nr:hypothetical protein [Patescibacteria group bacterium]
MTAADCASPGAPPLRVGAFFAGLVAGVALTLVVAFDVAGALAAGFAAAFAAGFAAGALLVAFAAFGVAAFAAVAFGTAALAAGDPLPGLAGADLALVSLVAGFFASVVFVASGAAGRLRVVVDATLSSSSRQPPWPDL